MDISKFLAVAVAVIVLYSVEATAQGEDIQSCIQKLIPCEKYLHTVSPHPPASCCGPLKEIMEKETVCLCTVFNNPEILKQLNITKEHALDLPKACGVNPDVSVCAKYASPTASPVSTNGTSSSSTISFNRFSFLSAFVALLLF